MVEKNLLVLMNGVQVGTLQKSEAGRIFFRYDDAWLSDPRARPLSLSLPLTEGELSGAPLLNFLMNLLPDDPLVIRAMQYELSLTSAHFTDLLAAAGKDCAGAVQFAAGGEEFSEMRAEALTQEQLEKRIECVRNFPLGMHEEEDFRLTLAGTQSKTALLRDGDTWFLPLSGTPTTHILKLPMWEISADGEARLSESCENEWLCLSLARKFELPAAEAGLLCTAGTRSLAVERFDRKRSADGRRYIRLPAEDFCQVLGVSPYQKYEADGGPGIIRIMDYLKLSAEAASDRRNFLSLQVFLWLIESMDGHAKNYSVFILSGGRFKLAPFYDILSAAPLAASGLIAEKKLRPAMTPDAAGRSLLMSEVRPQHFLSLAKRVGFPESAMRKILAEFSEKTGQTVKEMRKELPAGFPESTSEPIFRSLLEKAAVLKAFSDSF